MERNKNTSKHQPPHSKPGVTSSDSEPSQSRKTFLVELFGGLVLIAGLLGYSVYLMLEQPPDQLAAHAKQSAKSSPQAGKSSPTAKASPVTASPTATSPATAPTDTARSETSSTTDSEEIYQRPPRTGIYYAQNPLLNASHREIASNNGRLCIKVVNAPAAPLPGYKQILISSLSVRSNGIYIDATQEKIAFDRTLTEMKDSRGHWQLLENKADRTDMEECLAGTTPYAKELKGDYIQSSTEPPVIDIAEN